MSQEFHNSLENLGNPTSDEEAEAELARVLAEEAAEGFSVSSGPLPAVVNETSREEAEEESDTDETRMLQTA